MGKFDRKAHKEQKKLKPKRRKDHANFASYEDEQKRNIDILNMVRSSQGSKKVEHSL